MSQKMLCPVCSAYTSTILSRVMDGEPCPYCGTAAEVLLKIESLRDDYKDGVLRVEVERLTLDLAKAKARAEVAESTLARFKDLMETP